MAIIFDIKVIPGSRKQGWIKDKSGILKCYLKNQAEKGKANAELIKLIAKALHITQDQVLIVAGSQSKNKKIKADIDISYERLLELFGIQDQMNIFNN